MRKAELLRKLLLEKEIVRIVGAHNGMSAKLVEEAGFEGIWASGLEVSTAHAVPDANILTMTDHLEACINMNDSVSIPIIVDADTGYGNSNNVIYMVKKFEAAGIAAVCIEDKMFPKVNSFIPGRQELAPIGEFVGKIMAAKNAQETKEFCVFARVEALIAGAGMNEALKRGRAYVNAGADGVFIHSKSKDIQEICHFIKEWDMNAPLLVCPTTYPGFTVEEAIKSKKVKVYIFANQGIRAAVKAMEQTFSVLAQTGDIRKVTESIASMQKIFQLQGMHEMQENEKKYLYDGDKVQVIIPAAGDDSNVPSFQDILQDRPLGLLDINGKSILQRNIEILNNHGIKDMKIIAGYQKEKVKPSSISSSPESLTIIENNKYRQTGIAHSIMCARNQINEKVLVLFSDIIFESSILEQLLHREEDIVLVVDSCYRELKHNNKWLDLVEASYAPVSGDRVIHPERDNPIKQIGKRVPCEKATHEFIGMALFSKKGFSDFRKVYESIEESSHWGKFHNAESFPQADLTDMLQEMIDRGYKVSSLEIHKGWMEIQDFEDYKKACEMLKD
ncbi:MAG: isocitrate lyase/phosphoenolpyruvate mutase family protein [Candidatus Brocadiae bacterium]|nr:isocitrate lyase/phosphoenolpyruvate mutase family protein [Candidatus Brocadiia bacterium]